MIKNKSNLIILFLITFVGFVLRFWQLDKFPVSLNWDEVSHGYNAYSILKTGSDEWGTAFPLIFRAFGDYKLPVYIYLTVIPVFIFGLNAFAVRFISALAGVLAIPLIYLLTNQLFPNKKFSIGDIAAIILAITPWHFFISRPALEANLALTFILAGAYFILRGLLNARYYLLAAMFFSLSVHTYNTARVFVPLLLLVFIIVYRKSIRPRDVFTPLIIFFLSFSLVVYQIIGGTGMARYQKLTILSENAVFQIGQERNSSRLPPLVSRLVHNRPVYFAVTFSKNYLAYFSRSFINQSHGAQTQFAIPNQNLFTFPIFILSLLGVFYAIKNFSDSSSKFILGWLFLSPIAAAMTIDPPQALRPNPMIPAIILLASCGLSVLHQKTRLKIASFIIALSVTLFFSYLSTYFGKYQKNYSASWQFGYQEAVSYISENQDKFDRVIMTKRYGEPHIFYAFYTHLDPKQFVPGADNIRFMKSDWYWTDKIGKIYFINDWQIGTGVVDSLPLESGGQISTDNSLLVTSPDHLPINTTELKTINFLNGQPALVIAKFN